ncbi:MAG: hypothetical protein E4H05_03770 [Acidimicrobiales bacterium]|nr:MAG: hypothetical protein E4H05_03770 [Acidimicrobiales bacterium]
MTRRVLVGAAVLRKAHDEFGEARTTGGSPSEYDFVSGPLAAAVLVFRDFENLSFDLVPAVRTYTVVDPFFGPVVFVGVLTDENVVEIVDFAHDPDYWQLLGESTDT